MVRTKSVEETTRRYAQNSLRAYLEGAKTLNWIIGVIGSSGVRGNRLVEVFDRLRGYGDQVRYLEAKRACEDQGWM